MNLAKKKKIAPLVAIFAFIVMQIIDLVVFDPNDNFHIITPDHLEHVYSETHHANDNHLMSELHVSLHLLTNAFIHDNDITFSTEEIVKAQNQIRRGRVNSGMKNSPPVPPPLA